MKAFRLRIRTFLLAVIVLTFVLAWVVVPAWDYYRLPPSTRSILPRLGGPCAERRRGRRPWPIS